MVSIKECSVVFLTVASSVAKEFTARACHGDPGSSFFTSLADKDKLIAPVKERGNTNYKQQRYRAAIADYTTAVRLW